MIIQETAALVTGGASGLGAQTARVLAKRGAKVAVLDRNGAGAKTAAAEIGGIGLARDICAAIVENLALGGEVIGLDGTLRMAPR